jgi:hypothetical protein
MLLPFVAGAASPKSPATSKAPAQSKVLTGSKAPLLDTARIRKLYMDGEFEEAIELVEQALAEKRPFNHADSVFIFKHLGVMYAAKYETRELGKKYMFQLLMVEPTAKIMDMYASDMIYMIFKNIQDEFQTQRGRYAHAQELVEGNQQTGQEGKQPPSEEKPKTEPASSKHTLAWVGATGAIAAAGVAAYILLTPGGTKTVQRNHSVGGP